MRYRRVRIDGAFVLVGVTSCRWGRTWTSVRGAISHAHDRHAEERWTVHRTGPDRVRPTEGFDRRQRPENIVSVAISPVPMNVQWGAER